MFVAHSVIIWTVDYSTTGTKNVFVIMTITNPDTGDMAVRTNKFYLLRAGELVTYYHFVVFAA